jgi:hypothetical protein
MRERIGSMGWLAVGALLLGSVAAQAGDTIKLALPASTDVPAVKLGEIGLDADTIDARGGGHGGHYGGGHGGHYGGYHGGHYGGYHVGHYGGYRGYYGGYRGYYGGYRGYYGAYYRPYFYGAGYYGYQPYYYSSYYSAPSVYYYSSPVYCPIGLEGASVGTARIMPPADALNYRPDAEALPLPRDPGTYPYDGGPRAPVPMPRIDNPGDAPPARLAPPPTVPLDGRPVSLPGPKATPVKYSYPAYGELPRTK